ncbi:MAG: lipoprotein [Pseudomonadota bacterium]|jgi:predicted small lipoprotein YifL
MRLSALILGLALILSGCGTKGPLTLPPKPATADKPPQTGSATNNNNKPPAGEAAR